MTRAILHSDLNAFFASVETVLHPEYEGEAMAVCGAPEDRHGIVLAKSEKAKRAGVRTGMTVWEAKRACPSLILALPHYDAYLKFSSLVRKIYARYSDLVEPFGLDECWIDVSDSRDLFGSPEHIAHEIRQAVKQELGLTVSVGVSFNKVFAKLGSDLKKPDAVTVISPDNFRRIVWPLPVGSLLYAGPSTVKRLARMDISTVGELANTDEALVLRLLGVCGGQLWRYANGLDTARVMRADEVMPLQSVSHGITCNADLATGEEVRGVMLELAQEVGHRLAKEGLLATGIQIDIKDAELKSRQYMAPLSEPTRSRRTLTEAAYALFCRHYRWEKPVRAVAVRGLRLVRATPEKQLDCFGDYMASDRLGRLEEVMDDMTDRFGAHALLPADILTNEKTKCRVRHPAVLPKSRIG